MVRALPAAAAMVALAALACRGTPPDTADLQARIDVAADGDEVLLGPGVHRGPVVVRRRIALVGAGTEKTRLEADAGFALTLAATGARVSGVAIRGGEHGLLVTAGAACTARDVRIEVRATGVQVDAGAALAMNEATVACAAGADPPSPAGVVVAGGELRTRFLSVSGPCRRSLDVAAGFAELSGGSLEGARDTAARVVDGELRLSGVRAALGPEGASGAVVFAARARLTGRDVTLEGGEQGLLLRGGNAEISGLAIARVGAAGVALVGSHATLTQLDLTGPFSHGAILVGEAADATVRRLRVRRAGAVGVFVVGGTVEVEDALVAGARVDGDGDFGHGVSLTRSRGTLRDVRVEDSQGAAIYASDAVVAITKLRAEGVRAGLAATFRSDVTAQGVDVVAPARIGALAWGASKVTLTDARLGAEAGLVACAGSTIVERAGVVVGAVPARSSCRDEDLRRGTFRTFARE